MSEGAVLFAGAISHRQLLDLPFYPFQEVRLNRCSLFHRPHLRLQDFRADGFASFYAAVCLTILRFRK